MTTHTIQIEGVPEGWQTKHVVITGQMHVENGVMKCDAVAELHKIKPRRIVLEETEEE